MLSIMLLALVANTGTKPTPAEGADWSRFNQRRMRQTVQYERQSVDGVAPNTRKSSGRKYDPIHPPGRTFTPQQLLARLQPAVGNTAQDIIDRLKSDPNASKQLADALKELQIDKRGFKFKNTQIDLDSALVKEMIKQYQKNPNKFQDLVNDKSLGPFLKNLQSELDRIKKEGPGGIGIDPDKKNPDGTAIGGPGDDDPGSIFKKILRGMGDDPTGDPTDLKKILDSFRNQDPNGNPPIPGPGDPGDDPDFIEPVPPSTDPPSATDPNAMFPEMPNVDVSDTGGFLGNNPTENGGQGPSWFDRLDQLVAGGKSMFDTMGRWMGSVRSGMPSIPRLPRFNVPSMQTGMPRVPQFNMPSMNFPSVTEASPRRMMGWIMIIPVLGVVGFLLIRRLFDRGLGRVELSHGTAHGGSAHPEASPREKIVHLFERIALSLLGESARPQHHRKIQKRLAATAEGRDQSAQTLAELYQEARYAPPQEDLSEEKLAQAESAYLACGQRDLPWSTDKTKAENPKTT